MNIMRSSPYDLRGGCSQPLVNITLADSTRWVPSRFNARTTHADGSTIVWNSTSGSLSVFRPEQAERLNHYLSQEGHAGALDAFGEYLRQRGFVVPDGSNELRQFRHSFGEQHYRPDALELILLASEDCNFRCTYCYEDFRRGTMEPRVRTGLKRLVENRAESLKRLNISWFGGEPLYGWPAIEDLAPYFSQTAEEHGWRYSASMTTNGYLLTPDVAAKLISWRVRNFQITVDGVAEQHDRNRPGRDGSGTFERIFANLVALHRSESEFLVRLRVNFDNDTHPHLETLLCLLEKELQADTRFSLAFYGVGRWGGDNDENLNVCGVFETDDIRASLQASAYQKGLTFATLADRNLPGQGVCYAARPYNYVIGADGKVMKCTILLDKDPGNIVGVLGEDGTLDMSGDRFAKWVEPAFEADTNCQKCHLLPSCQGLSCPKLRFETNASPCIATVKHRIHDELIGAYNARRARARVATVRAGDCEDALTPPPVEHGAAR